ncbi:MAG: hypothetical protein JXL84_04810 [Deltaproteobacteria bacterium]|nr:hypothetical protein [Deltaproteobacteria bacterium]
MTDHSYVPPFAVKDCALIAIAEGTRAQGLRELREHLRDIDEGCIYYHFWGGLLRPRFDDPEYHNDFAIWVARALHNKRLAERLALIDPAQFESMEALRNELIEVIEESLDETEYPPLSRRDDQFEFVRSQIVVFDTKLTLGRPEELVQVLPRLSLGSIFFHCIDARRRNRNALDDFSTWLLDFGEEYRKVREGIEELCPYFSSLKDLRDGLGEIFRIHLERKDA